MSESNEAALVLETPEPKLGLWAYVFAAIATVGVVIALVAYIPVWWTVAIASTSGLALMAAAKELVRYGVRLLRR